MISPARRELLERRLSGDWHAASAAPTLRRRGVQQAPLTVGQEQMWYLAQLSPGNIAYNEAVTLARRGRFDAAAFERAFNELLRRHESLRTTFAVRGGEPVQVVNAPAPMRIDTVDLRYLPVADRDATAVRMATDEARRPYDLGAGPLVRPLLIRVADEEHRLYLAMHHIVFDGVALYRVLMPELVSLYESFAEGSGILPVPPPLQYADYAYWQREIRAQRGPDHGAMEYWRGRLADLPSLQLPTDHPRPRELAFQGAMQTMELGRNLSQAAIELARRERSSLFMLLMAAYHTLVHRYSGQDDIVIATVSDGRRESRLEGVIGYFLNPLILRADLSRRPSFRELLAQVRELTLAGLANEVPLPDLVRELRPLRDLSHNPLFQVLFSLEPPLAPLPPGWEFRQMDVVIGTAKFDLYLEQDQRPEGIIGRFVYDRNLFEASTIERMAGHWTTLLGSLVASPDAPVDSLQMLSSVERRVVVEGWNRTHVQIPEDVCVHGLFEAQVRLSPGAVAITGANRSVTYLELDQKAEQLARELRRRGVGPGALVGVCAPRSIETVAALLAVLKAGAAYVPLDPDYPDERLRYMIGDASLAGVIANRGSADWGQAAGCWVLDLADPDPETSPEAHAAAQAAAHSGDLAYVIYTSGSTGRPKGVMIEHRAVVNHVGDLVRNYGVGPGDTVLQLASLSFHPSVRDIFGTLCAGARLVLLSDADAKDPRLILDRLASERANCVLSLVPSLLKEILAEAIRRGGASPLRLVLTCGESLAVADAVALQRLFGCRIANQFGPTECVMAATAHDFGEADLGHAEVLAGRPVANARVYVLDAHGEPQPIGVPGELYVGGESLARGYLNRPVLTAERFLPDRFVGAGARMYRTGDFARLRSDGMLEFLGRRDFQVKIRGFRVELGEVEARLAEHPAVAEAAVTLASDQAGEQRLVGYFVPASGSAPDPEQLRTHLRGRLPDYMVPNVLVQLSSLPRTPSGKIDRRGLPSSGSELLGARRVGREPATALETGLARLWSRVLSLAEVGVEDDFFSLGGHSLLAVRLLSEVEATFDRRVSLAAFIRGGGTVRGLAQLVAEASRPGVAEGRVDANVVPVRLEGWLPPLLFIHSDELGALTLRNFTGALDPGRPLIGLLPDRVDRRFDPEAEVEGLAVGLLRVIRKLQPIGPYHLAGHSLGGLLAYEIAGQLAAAGEQVALLVLLDAATPAATAHYLQEQLRLSARLRRLSARLRRQRSRGVAGATLKTVEVARRHAERLRRRLTRTRPVPVGDDEFDIEGAIRLTKRYRPPGHAVPVTLFTTEAGEIACGDEWMGWRELHRGPLARRRVGGDHLTMLQEPNVAILAAELAGLIGAVCEAGTAAGSIS